MSRLARTCCFVILCAALCAPAPAGVVTLRDGRTLEGEVLLVGRCLVLRDAREQTQTLELDQVASAVFEPPVVSYPNPPQQRQRLENDPSSPGAILAEYFSDENFTERRLARYEPSIVAYWSTTEPPDPSIPQRCAVRYRARLKLPQGFRQSLSVETRGGARLWVNGEIKIDQWGKPGRFTAEIRNRSGETLDLRLEVGSGKSDFLARLYWRSSGGSPYIPSSAFESPAGSPGVPYISLAAPSDQQRFLAPDGIMLKAQARKDDEVASVDFLLGKTLLATVKKPPFAFRWNDPPTGFHTITARATGLHGIAGYSARSTISIAGNGQDGTLPAPWGDQIIVDRRKTRGDGMASFANGQFKLSKAGGQLTENNDSCLLVYQPIAGDFTMIAHLSSLTPADPQVAPLAGLMVRSTMRDDSRVAAVLVNQQGTQFVRRAEIWSRPASAERTQTAPCWLKILRHGSRLRGYCSADGVNWQAMGSDKIDMAREAMVGMCAMSRNEQTPCQAVFDQVQVIPGSPEMAASAPGVLFRSGTFVAGSVQGIREGRVLYTRGGQAQSVPEQEVARLVYQPMPLELQQMVLSSAGAGSGNSGVLLGSGDFIEGQVKEVSSRAVVSSVLFGPRSFNLHNGQDVMAVFLRDVDPRGDQIKYMLTAMDGCVYQAAALEFDEEAVNFDDPQLGHVQLLLKDLARLRIY